MEQKVRPNPGASAVDGGADAFGLWLEPPSQASSAKADPRRETPPASPQAPGRADPEMMALRAFRAGKGPLSSIATAPGASLAAAPAVCEDDRRPAADNFRPLDRATAVLAALLTALVVIGGHAVVGDVERTDTFRAIRRQNQEIQDYNHTRNILVQHLAKNQNVRLSQLRTYADPAAGARKERGVIVYVPQDGRPVVRTVPRLEFDSAARAAPEDDEDIQEWTPPPVLEGYEALRFDAEELAGTRIPLGATLVGVLVALAAWSSMAHRNLPALQAHPSWFRPGSIPFWWFAPVANLYFPCAVMKEIWAGSDPRSLTQPTAVRLPVVGLWWMALLGSIGLFATALFHMASAVGIDEMLKADEQVLYADIGVTAMAVLTLGLVAAATWNQTRRHRLVRSFERQLGPREAWRAQQD